jgi:signal transduction histidine kinase
MDKRYLWINLALYTFSTVTFLFLLFIYFESQGIGWRNFWIGMIFFVPAVMAVGYLILGDLADGKQRQDKRLEMMIREVLHEINLPVSTIETNIQMLSSRIRDTKDLKRLERIQGSADRLKHLYNLLSYNIKREISKVETERFDLDQIVRQRVAVFEDMQRNHFKLDLSHHEVLLDKIGFEQVLDNIISNSMKYSSPDTPIAISIHDSSIEVLDHGEGMDATQIARIYERYYQGDSHNPGEGIGLALVKRYCDDHGIDLKITSQPGIGTKVVLDLAKVTQK